MRGAGLVVALAVTGLVWPAVGGAQGAKPGPKLGPLEYEGWRQYSTHCARCHGQDVLGNPVAAIYAYVKGRADGKIPAGRPQRAGT